VSQLSGDDLFKTYIDKIVLLIYHHRLFRGGKGRVAVIEFRRAGRCPGFAWVLAMEARLAADISLQNQQKRGRPFDKGCSGNPAGPLTRLAVGLALGGDAAASGSGAAR
jgi:hypothetical protein